ncbi:MAG: bifunctional serine/threonine-protein kinase/formylglycine-generating enzyme family protein [Planctomycetota bacterium]
MTEADSKPATDRLGPYRLLSTLGQGGMAVVYLGLEEGSGRHVAVKVVRLEGSATFEIEACFRREIEALAALRHPHIVRVLASGEEKGLLYYAMDYVPGRGLDEIIREAASGEGGLATARVLGWIRDIARALHCAHESGIVHRDVKPSNIRITPEDRAVLVDFGIARTTDLTTLTVTGGFRGTPRYASPEQVGGERGAITALTDVYSLGATLYEAVTGAPPVGGVTTDAIFHEILYKDPEPARHRNAMISGDLEAVIETAMEKSRSRRYLTMAAFGDDLDRLLSGEDVHARHLGIVKRLWRRAKRRPALCAALIAAAASLSSLAVLTPLYAIQLARERTRATELFQQMTQLSDLEVIRELVAEAEQLWPAAPEVAGALESWLGRANDLIARLPLHRGTLEQLHSRTVPRPGPETTDPRTFADPADQWWHETLTQLIAEIDAVASEGTRSLGCGSAAGSRGCGSAAGLRDRLSRRLDFARNVRKWSIEDHRAAWQRAIASVADRLECPGYQGLQIEPQLGLVPVGRDSASELWEFAHLETGAIPERDGSGMLVIDDESGLVFVLVPGGTFMMGAERPSDKKRAVSPNVDPGAMPSQGPVHAVQVPAFFISKYEMTQGQWLRATGMNPSLYCAPEERWAEHLPTLSNPVESVSCIECERVLSRLGLRLPSEAEWEYAARAGTSSVWWCGNDEECLSGRACFAGSRDLSSIWVSREGDEGYRIHARADSYAPNAFGLHNVIGNVREWCQDVYDKRYEKTPRDGSAQTVAEFMQCRVSRGGGFSSPGRQTKSAARFPITDGVVSPDQGVRPARSLVRSR